MAQEEENRGTEDFEEGGFGSDSGLEDEEGYEDDEWDEDIEEQESDAGAGTPALFSPEGVIMLIAAVFVDLLGLILTIIVFVFPPIEIINWISDILGLLIFGPWILMRVAAAKIFGGAGPETQVSELPGKVAERRAETAEAQKAAREAMKQAKAAAQAGKKGARAGARMLRFAFVFIAELIPFIGLLPFWTWFVYTELKEPTS